MANYSDILVYLRTRSKLTQEEAAKRIGISRSSLANYEKGLRRPSFETMEAIADFYNVNMDTIFGHSEIPSDYQFVSSRNQLNEEAFLNYVSQLSRSETLELAQRLISLAAKEE